MSLVVRGNSVGFWGSGQVHVAYIMQMCVIAGCRIEENQDDCV